MKEFYVVQVRVNGVVIEESKTEGTGFSMIRRTYLRLVKNFFDHLKVALLNPDEFSFTGSGCQNWSAEQWLDYHKQRLSNDLKGSFELVEDGKIIDRFVTKIS